jgi:formylglycine-generating enzyme required for sulfatase activity
LRGGSWLFDSPVYFRCASRYLNPPVYRSDFYGFRVVGRPARGLSV